MEYPPCVCHPFYRKCTCFTIFLWTFCILTSLDPLPNSFFFSKEILSILGFGHIFRNVNLYSVLAMAGNTTNFGRVSFGSGWFQLTMVLSKNDMVAQGSDGQILITIVIIEQLPKAQEYLAWFGAKIILSFKGFGDSRSSKQISPPHQAQNSKEKRVEVLRCFNAGTGQMRLHQNWLLCLPKKLISFGKKNGWSLLFETDLFGLLRFGPKDLPMFLWLHPMQPFPCRHRFQFHPFVYKWIPRMLQKTIRKCVVTLFVAGFDVSFKGIVTKKLGL